jgi:hypothetical protein
LDHADPMPWTAPDASLLLLASVALQQALTIRLARIDRDFDATILLPSGVRVVGGNWLRLALARCR